MACDSDGIRGTGRSQCFPFAAQLGYALFDGFGSCVSNHDDLRSDPDNELELDSRTDVPVLLSFAPDRPSPAHSLLLAIRFCFSGSLAAPRLGCYDSP